jgi:alkylation response protein AidB-like acyl-CoA dehydrogenase
VDLELTDEHKALRQLARDFADREIAPFARDWDRTEQLDRGIVAKLADIGFLGAGIPERYCGTPIDNIGYSLVIEELGRADSSVRGVVTVHLGLVAKTILTWGTDDQRERWLPALTTGHAIGCFALTEPGAGSDAANLATRAHQTGDGWRLTGSKTFITNGTWADVALIFARTGGPGAKGITCFLVPTGRDGIQRRPVKGKLGLRAQDTAEIFFDDVAVTEGDIVGGLNSGFKVAMSTLDRGRMSLAAGCVGIAQACLEAALGHASSRETFGRPIAAHQLVQQMLADISVELEAARLLTWRAAALADAGRRHTLESSQAKYYASETAVRAANAALQIFGGYGYIDEYPVGRYLRDARVSTLYEGTSQIQQLVIGRILTGHSAFDHNPSGA